mmetsp:Transcript_65123/g.76498  ORF Transcript_65123/g.76498 Transcript_65123/m.76498 type:complete len:603 (+) Transcript_65123:41-1849(+)
MAKLNTFFTNQFLTLDPSAATVQRKLNKLIDLSERGNSMDNSLGGGMSAINAEMDEPNHHDLAQKSLTVGEHTVDHAHHEIVIGEKRCKILLSFFAAAACIVASLVCTFISAKNGKSAFRLPFAANLQEEQNARNKDMTNEITFIGEIEIEKNSISTALSLHSCSERNFGLTTINSSKCKNSFTKADSDMDGSISRNEYVTYLNLISNNDSFFQTSFENLPPMLIYYFQQIACECSGCCENETSENDQAIEFSGAKQDFLLDMCRCLTDVIEDEIEHLKLVDRYPSSEHRNSTNIGSTSHSPTTHMNNRPTASPLTTTIETSDAPTISLSLSKNYLPTNLNDIVNLITVSPSMDMPNRTLQPTATPSRIDPLHSISLSPTTDKMPSQSPTNDNSVFITIQYEVNNNDGINAADALSGKGNILLQDLSFATEVVVSRILNQTDLARRLETSNQEESVNAKSTIRPSLLNKLSHNARIWNKKVGVISSSKTGLWRADERRRKDLRGNNDHSGSRHEIRQEGAALIKLQRQLLKYQQISVSIPEVIENDCKPQTREKICMLITSVIVIMLDRDEIVIFEELKRVIMDGMHEAFNDGTFVNSLPKN